VARPRRPLTLDGAIRALNVASDCLSAIAADRHNVPIEIRVKALRGAHAATEALVRAEIMPEPPPLKRHRWLD
jgi:hypothetical protein